MSSSNSGKLNKSLRPYNLFNAAGLSLLLLRFIVAIMFLSCKKELSCIDCRESNNKPPKAVAGPDQVITLPTDSTLLDGSSSSDPDGRISEWLWTKVAGPASFTIRNPSSSKTIVKDLKEGTYQFELKVTDVEGLSSRDTVQVHVENAIHTCSNTNRIKVKAELVPFDTLSQARFWMGVASAGNKIVFAGGHTYGNLPSSRVDIYDVTTKTWSTARLSLARAEISAVALGNKIFFAGGVYYDSADIMWDNPHAVNVMDIYDVVSNTWSVVPLIGNRTYTAPAATGNKIFFVNGSEVDIYNTSAQTWSTKTFSDKRYSPSVVAEHNKVFFAGGHIMQGGIVIPKNTIDIYGNASNTWSVLSLAEGKLGAQGIAVAGKIYFAGGYNSNINNPPFTTTCIVDVVDANSESKSVQYLSRQWQHPAGWAAIKDSKIAFPNFHWNSNEFDIYDVTTDTWSIGVLPSLQNLNFWGASILSVNNTIYIAGAFTGFNLPQHIYTMEF